MSRWYSRPVIFVADVDRASSFYVEKLGFAEAWRHCEQDKTLVAQVDRAGCELILSCQQPRKVGCALVFISLDQADVVPVRRSFEQAWLESTTLCGTDAPDLNLRFESSSCVAHGKTSS